MNVNQQGIPAMGVAVAAGTAAIPSGNGYPYIIWSTVPENVTLDTADGSNPRIDLTIAYVDLSVVSSTSSNNPNAWSFLKVTGTPSGSPAVPNAAAIQAALPNSSYPYIILAQVAVAAGATTITIGNITDLRSIITPLSGAQKNTVYASETTSSTTFTDLTTVESLTVNIGANGMALVLVGGEVANDTNDKSCIISFLASGANSIGANDSQALTVKVLGGKFDVSGSNHILLTGLNQGPTNFKLQFRVTGGTGTFVNRNLTVIPL